MYHSIELSRIWGQFLVGWCLKRVAWWLTCLTKHQNLIGPTGQTGEVNWSLAASVAVKPLACANGNGNGKSAIFPESQVPECLLATMGTKSKCSRLVAAFRFKCGKVLAFCKFTIPLDSSWYARVTTGGATTMTPFCILNLNLAAQDLTGQDLDLVKGSENSERKSIIV